MRKVVWFAVLAAIAPLAEAKQRAAGQTLVAQRILFVGNSLTFENDLPSIVCRLAAMTGKPLTCATVAFGNASLLDHLQVYGTGSVIANGHYTIVAMQQGPSALATSREELLSSTQRFATLIREAGGRPAMYAVWPSKERSFDFDRVAESYRLAAVSVDGLLFPVGSAWEEAWRVDPSLPLYGDDDFHPSVAGSYLAALVIYRVLYGALPSSFATPAVARNAAGAELGIDERALRILVDAAQE